MESLSTMGKSIFGNVFVNHGKNMEKTCEKIKNLENVGFLENMENWKMETWKLLEFSKNGKLKNGEIVFWMLENSVVYLNKKHMFLNKCFWQNV